MIRHSKPAPISQPRIGTQSGQVLIEAMLLLVIFVGVARMASDYFHSHQVASKLVEQPWTRLAGMIECGVWQPCNTGTPGLHPMTVDRILSLSPSKKAGNEN